MAAIDLKKTHRDLYSPGKKGPTLVQVPDFPYLMVDGKGDPNTSPAFQEAIGALYGLSYTLRFALKKEGYTYTVMPLEGLFSADDPSAFLDGRKHEWEWTLMIMQPKEVGKKRFEEARASLVEKKRLSSFPDVRLEKLSEGLCAQILHLGPYSAEGPTIKALHQFMQEYGYGFGGRHHEIYLSAPGRVAPEKMRTVIRQPLRKLPRR